MTMLLIISHPRSGSHLVIDSLRKNIIDTEFLISRPSFSTIENLFLPHDSEVTKNFYDFTFNRNEKIRIFKTHLLPLEFEAALSIKHFFSFPDDRKIVEHIYRNAIKIFIYRDVKDAMTSWFIFNKNGGGLQNLMRARIEKATISEFIRYPNAWIMPCREFKYFDENLITYWAYHRKSWLERNDVITLDFQNLKNNFQETFDSLVVKIGLKDKMVHAPSVPDAGVLPKNRIFRALQVYVLNRFKRKSFKSSAVAPFKGKVGSHSSYFKSKEDTDFILDNIKKIEVSSQVIQ